MMRMAFLTTMFLTCLGILPAATQTSHTAPIIEQLAKPRSSQRDRRLYALAIELFKAIEAGQEPEAGRDVMARAIREATESDIPEAWLDYGRCLWNGWGVREDREAAMAAYKKAAALGSAEAAFVLANNLVQVFHRHDDEAYAYAKQALRDDPEGNSRYLLGLIATRRGRPEDFNEALNHHLKAAQLGHEDALFELYALAMNGVGDRGKALFYLREAAERGQPRAMANLGALYASAALGLPLDYDKSVFWYRRAAERKIGRAAAALGVMALKGQGMPADPETAKTYFARAEALGFELAPYLSKLGLARP